MRAARHNVKNLLAALSLVTDSYSPAWPRVAALLSDP
jgi:hypothetical protein